MELQVQSISSGTAAGNVALSDEVFGTDFNEGLVHQVVTAYMAAGRAGTKAQKSRAEVAGGGRKPWRQKGTGRARAGTIRSPLWRGGGRAFAARPRSFEQKVNRKMYRAALRAILSELVRQDRLVVVDDLQLAEPKTKLAVATLARLGLHDVLLVSDEISENLFLAARNIPHVGMADVGAIDPVLLVSYDKVVVTQKALEKLEAMFK
ncbi:MAG: 50S ribosomal protein L4 [Gammaproteobacteria bacterium]|nr:50S ribosomal protein L4 [Gammaproteobacteria bacterium]